METRQEAPGSRLLVQRDSTHREQQQPPKPAEEQQQPPKPAEEQHQPPEPAEEADQGEAVDREGPRWTQATCGWTQSMD